MYYKRANEQMFDNPSERKREEGGMSERERERVEKARQKAGEKSFISSRTLKIALCFPSGSILDPSSRCGTENKE